MNKQKKNESIYKRMILLFLLITGVGGVLIFASNPITSVNNQIIPQFGISSLSKQHKLLVILDVKAVKCSGFVIEETVCRQCRNHTHDEIVDRPVP